MSTNAAKGDFGPPASGSNASTSMKDKVDSFDDCVPQSVSVAKVMDPERVDEAWKAIYSSAGIASAGENIKKSARCAVYTYFAANGTSDRSGMHGIVKSGAGTTIRMESVAAAIGAGSYRRFMRACARESVAFHRATQAYERIPEIRAKCEDYAVPLADAVALCDWLDAYDELTPSERGAQTQIKASNLARSRAARGNNEAGQQDSAVESRRLAAARQSPEDSVF